MIKRFKVSNFKSIIDIDLNFDYGERCPNKSQIPENTILYHQQRANNKLNRIIPIASFFGANASGKTNIVDAIFEFKKLITKDLEYCQYNPYRLKPMNDNFTTFELELLVGKKDCIYTINYNQEEIIGEKFVVNGKLIFEAINGKISQQELKKQFENSCMKDTKQNIPFLRILAKNYQNQIKEATSFFDFVCNKIEIFYTNKFPNYISIDAGGFNEIIDLLKRLDLNIQKAEYQRFPEINTEQIFDGHLKFGFRGRRDDEVKTYHKDTNGELRKFDLEEESLGTRILFSLLGFWLKALKEGQIVFFDELERSLHPLLLKALISTFKNKQYNKNNAQLIFTTHCIDMLEYDSTNLYTGLRKTDIFIVDNKLTQGTSIKRLNEFQDVRNVNDFRKKYLDNYYGGIPHCFL